MRHVYIDAKYHTRLEAAQRKVVHLSTELWHELWPHDSVLRDTPHSRIMLGQLPAEDARIAAVTDTADVAVDDLVVIIDTAGERAVSYDILGVLTGREVMDRHPAPGVGKIVAKTAKTISVVMIPTPYDGWECDLSRFAQRAYDSTPTTLTLKARTRRIGRLGTMQEIHEGITRHRRFREWVEAYEEAKTAQREVKDATARRAAEEETREQALGKIADIVNRAMGVRMFCEDVNGRTGIVGWELSRFFEKRDRLRVHMAGLHALGKLTDDEYALVEEQLTIAKEIPVAL